MTMINQPVTPGIGPEGLPTPSLPGNEPAAPDPGPEGLPTPSLPGPVQPAPLACPQGFRARTVPTTQNFTDLLIDNNVSFDALSLANPTLSTSRVARGTRYCAPPSQSRRLCAVGFDSYIMELGEDLYAVSRRFGLSAGVLLRANPMLAPTDFIPGRVICVP